MKYKNSSSDITPDFIDAMVDVIQQSFKQVRPLILDRVEGVEFTSKHDGSPVTDSDREIEKIVFEIFENSFPDFPIFGEESGYSDKLPDACWLIDPIDGTKSYIMNIPAFTNMAVLIVDEEALACVIYNPSSDEMFVAKKGHGAYKNNSRLDLSQKDLPVVAHCKGRFIESLNSILKPNMVTCEIAKEGAGYGFTMVADCKSAARFQLLSRGGIHDYAPGALLVSEAGGCIIPLKEKVYTYKTNSFVACHPDLADTIRQNIDFISVLENKLN